MSERTFAPEDAALPTKQLSSILCSSSCRNMSDPATYTPFRLFGADMSAPLQWPKKTDICCWYCCHGFPTTPVCIPAQYSLERRLFHVFGIFCSWNCAKAYVQSTYSSDSSEQLMWMRILAHEVFGCDIDELKSAPPRIFLRMFGGHLSIDEFRAKSSVAMTVALEPPLVSHPIMLQEVGDESKPAAGGQHRGDLNLCRVPSAPAAGLSTTASAPASGRVFGLRRTSAQRPERKEAAPDPQNAMYVQFMQRKQEEVTPPAPDDDADAVQKTAARRSPSAAGASSRSAADAPPPPARAKATASEKRKRAASKPTKTASGGSQRGTLAQFMRRPSASPPTSS